MAERTSLSAARLSRVENGTSLLSLPEIGEWASAVGADTDARARLHQPAEAAHTPAVEAFRHGGPDLQRSVLDLEARAGRVVTVQPTIVPALLQTVAYARAVLNLADVTSQDISATVALRQRRQELLHDSAKRFGFLLTEAALRWPAGDAHRMATQYDRIAQISTLPNVTVGVIPLGRQVSALPWCDINLYESCGDGEPPIIDIELSHGEIWVVDPIDIDVYKGLVGKLRVGELRGVAQSSRLDGGLAFVVGQDAQVASHVPRIIIGIREVLASIAGVRLLTRRSDLDQDGRWDHVATRVFQGKTRQRGRQLPELLVDVRGRQERGGGRGEPVGEPVRPGRVVATHADRPVDPQAVVHGRAVVGCLGNGDDPVVVAAGLESASLGSHGESLLAQFREDGLKGRVAAPGRFHLGSAIPGGDVAGLWPGYPDRARWPTRDGRGRTRAQAGRHRPDGSRGRRAAAGPGKERDAKQPGDDSLAAARPPPTRRELASASWARLLTFIRHRTAHPPSLPRFVPASKPYVTASAPTTPSSRPRCVPGTRRPTCQAIPA
ncbi:DUF5753 domain-containing protein [Parafrankia discariae]|uniref:DUF5753 domain-containing protein n=1 Tax=Parafrankia discariae TaxID=365528 RepID=UPI00097686C7|nr:DUF5753 domain-containing protein [Parafrankia discariae]